MTIGEELRAMACMMAEVAADRRGPWRFSNGQVVPDGAALANGAAGWLVEVADQWERDPRSVPDRVLRAALMVARAGRDDTAGGAA